MLAPTCRRAKHMRCRWTTPGLIDILEYIREKLCQPGFLWRAMPAAFKPRQ
jgi:hypothetical protein